MPSLLVSNLSHTKRLDLKPWTLKLSWVLRLLWSCCQLLQAKFPNTMVELWEIISNRVGSACPKRVCLSTESLHVYSSQLLSSHRDDTDCWLVMDLASCVPNSRSCWSIYRKERNGMIELLDWERVKHLWGHGHTAHFTVVCSEKAELYALLTSLGKINSK